MPNTFADFVQQLEEGVLDIPSEIGGGVDEHFQPIVTLITPPTHRLSPQRASEIATDLLFSAASATLLSQLADYLGNEVKMDSKGIRSFLKSFAAYCVQNFNDPQGEKDEPTPDDGSGHRDNGSDLEG